MTWTLDLLLSPVAGLRRSFRLSRKDRRGSSGDGSDSGDSEYMTYEEVTRYQQKPHERPRLVVLIGEVQYPAAAVPPGGGAAELQQCFKLQRFKLQPDSTFPICAGSLGARINELKQRVIADNPHHFAVAVPRELPNTNTPALCIRVNNVARSHRHHQAQEASREGGCGVPLCHQATV